MTTTKIRREGIVLRHMTQNFVLTFALHMTTLTNLMDLILLKYGCKIDAS